MEFWGAEVKVGESVKVDPVEFEACIHLSQAALGEAKKDKGNEPVVVYLKVGEQKFVLGTLSREKIPQISLELVLEKEFELSHNSKNASVYFYSDEDLPVINADNGKPETKAEDLKVPEPKKPDAKVSASAKQVKVVDPKKDNVEDSDDDSDEDDDFGSSDEEMGDADSDSDEDDSDEDDDEETPPKKVEVGKKRTNESASKTPVSSKKAKNSTPEKTDGKKTGHTATPHPKKGGKTPSSDTKDKTPKSGGLSCKSCNKSFNSDSGLQQHNKAKHGVMSESEYSKD
ncbi:Histone deacetylase HDT1, partial [Mucuna pruriens]